MNESDAYASNKTQGTVPHSRLFNNLVKKKEKKSNKIVIKSDVFLSHQ